MFFSLTIPLAYIIMKYFGPFTASRIASPQIEYSRCSSMYGSLPVKKKQKSTKVVRASNSASRINTAPIDNSNPGGGESQSMNPQVEHQLSELAAFGGIEDSNTNTNHISGYDERELPTGPINDASCDRKTQWENGQPDYLGVDRFDNIVVKLNESMDMAPDY